MTITQTQQASLYRKAAQAIRDRGLTKRAYVEGPGGALCTVGALHEVNDTDHRVKYGDSPVLRYLADLLGTSASPCVCGIAICPATNPAFAAVTEWNDLPTTTAQDVITLLETAAEKLEANQP